MKKALLSDKVTLPRNDFDNLLNAAKQYVVYRRQDDRLQGLLDAANAKIMQLESVVGELACVHLFFLDHAVEQCIVCFGQFDSNSHCCTSTFFLALCRVLLEMPVMASTCL